MKLALSIAAAWAAFDLLAGKALLGIILPIDAQIWQQIVRTVAAASH